MAASDVQGASHPSRRLLGFSLLSWTILAIALPLTALTLNAVKVAGFPLGFLTTSVIVLVGLAALAMIFAKRAGGDQRTHSVAASLRMASEAIGAAGVIGAVGAIAALGYDGLAFPLGMAAGLALLTIAIAPRFALYPVTSIAGFFSVRYGGRWPRRLALIIATLGSIGLLAADLRGGALVMQGAFATDYATGVATTAVALAVLWLARALLPSTSSRGLVFAALLLLVLVPVIAYALDQGRWPVPLVGLGHALDDLSAIEQTLIVNKLADVRSLKPMAAPFLQLSMANFAGLVLALALGIAALPYLLGRHVAQGSVAPGAAPQRAARATVWLVLFLLALASFAVFERIGVAQLLSKGIETAAIPDAVRTASDHGWLTLCGLNTDVAAEISAACAKSSGNRGFLRLQDIAFTSDGFALAAPSISGLADYLWWPFWLAAGMAALVTGHAIVAGLLAADGEGRRQGSVDATNLDARSVLLATAVLLSALALAMLTNLEIPALFSEGLAVLAAGLFPALLLGLFWRRMSGAGANAAMVTGLAITIAYIVGAHYFPVLMYQWTGALSDAAPGAVRKFAQLQQEYAGAVTEDARDTAWLALRRHAAGIANISGLKPAAIVVFAVPAALVVGLLVSLLKPLPKLASD